MLQAGQRVRSSSVGDYLTLGLVPQGNCGRCAKIAACHPISVSKRLRNGISVRLTTIVKCVLGRLKPTPGIVSSYRPGVYHGHPHYEKGCLAPGSLASIPKAHVLRNHVWSTFGYRIDRFEPLIPCIESVVQDPQHM
jgi:hypothetical protein